MGPPKANETSSSRRQTEANHDFLGESETEVPHARQGQKVWALWKAESGWVPVFLDDGGRGNVPEAYVEWTR